MHEGGFGRDQAYDSLVDGMKVRFKRYGYGPTLLLLHGSGASLDSFDEIAWHLAWRFDVVRMDLPGFGHTGPRPDRDYRIETYVEFLRLFMIDQQIEHCVLGGHSLGGNIAWNFAVTHPEQVDRLILMNATGYPDKALPPAFLLARNPVGRQLMRHLGARAVTAHNLRQMVGPDFQVPESMIDRAHELMDRPGNREAFIDFARTDQKNNSSAIPKIVAPTLILRGSDIDGQHFGRDISDSVEKVLPGVGHLMPEEAAVEVARAIIKFTGVRS
jgi:pimeloyl-ACP methyl ester carboxylesterase